MVLAGHHWVRAGGQGAEGGRLGHAWGWWLLSCRSDNQSLVHTTLPHNDDRPPRGAFSETLETRGRFADSAWCGEA